MSERDSIVHYIIPLSFTILDVLAGATATLIFYLTGKISWIIILLPILLTIRGDISGVFVGVLTTNLKLGSIKPNFLNNTKEYYGLVFAILSLTASNSVISSILIITYLGVTGASFNPLSVFSVTILTFYISSVFSILVTSWVGFFTFKQSSKYATDPDKYVYPIISIINDVLVGIFVYSVTLIVEPWETDLYTYIYAIFSLALILATMFGVYKYRNNIRLRKTIREAYIAVLIGLSLSTVSGLFLESQLELISNFLPLLIIYPAIIALMGNMGVMISSQFTTMLWLGEVKIGSEQEFKKLILSPKFISMAKKTIFSSYVVVTAISLLAQIFYIGNFWSDFVKTLLISTATLTILFIFLIYPISVFVSLKLYQYGFDPDNFIISIITTLCDFVGLLLLILVASLII